MITILFIGLIWLPTVLSSVCESQASVFPNIDALNCESYFSCHDYIPHLHDCPDGFQFHYRNLQCQPQDEVLCDLQRLDLLRGLNIDGRASLEYWDHYDYSDDLYGHYQPPPIATRVGALTPGGPMLPPLAVDLGPGLTVDPMLPPLATAPGLDPPPPGFGLEPPLPGLGLEPPPLGLGLEPPPPGFGLGPPPPGFEIGLPPTFGYGSLTPSTVYGSSNPRFRYRSHTPSSGFGSVPFGYSASQFPVGFNPMARPSPSPDLTALEIPISIIARDLISMFAPFLQELEHPSLGYSTRTGNGYFGINNPSYYPVFPSMDSFSPSVLLGQYPYEPLPLFPTIDSIPRSGYIPELTDTYSFNFPYPVFSNINNIPRFSYSSGTNAGYIPAIPRQLPISDYLPDFSSGNSLNIPYPIFINMNNVPNSMYNSRSHTGYMSSIPPQQQKSGYTPGFSAPSLPYPVFINMNNIPNSGYTPGLNAGFIPTLPLPIAPTATNAQYPGFAQRVGNTYSPNSMSTLNAGLFPGGSGFGLIGSVFPLNLPVLGTGSQGLPTNIGQTSGMNGVPNFNNLGSSFPQPGGGFPGFTGTQPLFNGNSAIGIQGLFDLFPGIIGLNTTYPFSTWTGGIGNTGSTFGTQLPPYQTKFGSPVSIGFANNVMNYPSTVDSYGGLSFQSFPFPFNFPNAKTDSGYNAPMMPTWNTNYQSGVGTPQTNIPYPYSGTQSVFTNGQPRGGYNVQQTPAWSTQNAFGNNMPFPVNLPQNNFGSPGLNTPVNYPSTSLPSPLGFGVPGVSTGNTNGYFSNPPTGYFPTVYGNNIPTPLGFGSSTDNIQKGSSYPSNTNVYIPPTPVVINGNNIPTGLNTGMSKGYVPPVPVGTPVTGGYLSTNLNNPLPIGSSSTGTGGYNPTFINSTGGSVPTGFQGSYTGSVPVGFGNVNNGGYIPMTGGFKPNNNVYFPNTGNYIPNTNGYIPNTNGYIPNTSSYIPNSGAYIPNTNGYVPNTGGYVPNTNSYVPNTGGYAPRNSGYLPNTGGYVPTSFTANSNPNNINPSNSNVPGSGAVLGGFPGTTNGNSYNPNTSSFQGNVGTNSANLPTFGASGVGVAYPTNSGSEANSGGFQGFDFGEVSGLTSGADSFNSATATKDRDFRSIPNDTVIAASVVNTPTVSASVINTNSTVSAAG